MTTSTATDEIRQANTRYHDLAAEHYDAKWGIDYGERGRAQVTGKLRKAIGTGSLGRYERGLEIGAGTGYFGLNLALAGVVGQLTATDISPGMLAVLEASAQRLGVPLVTASCAARELPFEDDSFDLVFGHAVLHHLPDLEGPSASSCACCGPAARSPSVGSRRCTATGSPRCPSASPTPRPRRGEP